MDWRFGEIRDKEIRRFGTESAGRFGTESAGINRYIVGDGRALRKRRSDSIPASSLACDLVRGHSEA
jgi:hypothetical protein